MVPPSDRKYAPIASAMDCDPPFGMGQPLRCPAMVSTKAMAEDVSASNGIMLWATMPAHRPLAPRVRKRAAICFPACKDFKPNCEIVRASVRERAGNEGKEQRVDGTKKKNKTKR